MLSQNFFMQSLPLYVSCLFSMLLNENNSELKKPESNMFAYFCCRWVFRIIFPSINFFYSTLKICINNEWCFVRFLVLIKFYYFSVIRRHYYVTKIFIFTSMSLFYVIEVYFPCRKNENNSDNKNHHGLLIMKIVFWMQDNAIVSLCLK